MEEARRFRLTGAPPMVNQRGVCEGGRGARAARAKVGKDTREKASERGLAKGKQERWPKREGEH